MQHSKRVRIAVREEDFFLFLRFFKVERESQHRVVDYFGGVFIPSANYMRSSVLDVVAAFDPFVVMALLSVTDAHSISVQGLWLCKVYYTECNGLFSKNNWNFDREVEPLESSLKGSVNRLGYFYRFCQQILFYK